MVEKGVMIVLVKVSVPGSISVTWKSAAPYIGSLNNSALHLVLVLSD